MNRSKSYFSALAMLAGIFGATAHAGAIVVDSKTSTENKAKKQEAANVGTYQSNQRRKALLAGGVKPHKRQGLVLDSQRKLREHLRSNPNQRRKYGK